MTRVSGTIGRVPTMCATLAGPALAASQTRMPGWFAGLLIAVAVAAALWILLIRRRGGR